MANGKNKKCRNRRNHNCSPCPQCGESTHDWDVNGQCLECGSHESDTDERYRHLLNDYPAGGGRRVNKKRRRFDDDDDW